MPIGPPIELGRLPIERGPASYGSVFTPDGQRILSAGQDNKVHFWDAGTGLPLGPPIEISDGINKVIVTADGRVLVIVTSESIQFLNISEIPDDPLRVQDWVQVATGLTIAGQDEIRSLDEGAYRRLREMTERVGVPLQPKASRSADPVAPRTVPWERVRELIPWAMQDKLALELDTMILIRPDDSELLYVRGLLRLSLGFPSLANGDFSKAFALGHREPNLIDRLIEDNDVFQFALGQAEDQRAIQILTIRRAGRLARQGQWMAAAALYEDAVASSPDSVSLRRRQLLTLFAAGDDEGFDQVRAEMIEPFLDSTRKAIGSPSENNVAWLAALTPEDAGEFDELERRVSASVNVLSQWGEHYADEWKADLLRTRGALLYRLGRYAEAEDSLDKAIGITTGKTTPQEWAFLAMVHHRLGRRDEARHCLDRCRDRQPSSHPAAFWNEIEIRLLRSEAEAVVLWDPIFPADPFAP
jgi:tetratricopeptide (TPR) repeat protein